MWNWREAALAGVAATAVVNPTLALRGGAFICVAVLIAGWASFRPQTTDVLAVCLAIFTAASSLWTVSPEDTTLAVKNQLAVAALLLAVRVVALNLRGLVVIVVGYLAGCGYVLVKQIQGAALVAQSADGNRYGIEGLNVNYTAYSLCTGVALVVILWIWRPPLAGRLVLLAIAGALVFGEVRTGTRGGELSLLGIGLWVGCFRFAPRRGLLALYGVVAVAALATLTGYFDRLILPYLNRTARETGDLNGRLFMWPHARRIIADHLFIGTGARSFRVLNPMGSLAHNALLDLGTGLGLIGMSLFVAVLVTALITGTRAMDVRTRAFLVGSMVVVSAPIFLSGVWDQSPAAWVGIGLFSRVAVLAPRPHPVGLETLERGQRLWPQRVWG